MTKRPEKVIKAYELLPGHTYLFEVKTSSGLDQVSLQQLAEFLDESNITVHFLMTEGENFSIQAVPTEEKKL